MIVGPIQSEISLSFAAEIQIKPTPEYETWRVRPQSLNGPNGTGAFSQLLARRVNFSKLYGLGAVDIPTAGIFCAERMQLDARRDGVNDFKILLQLSGRSTVVQDERTTELAAGDLGLIDLSRPIQLKVNGERGRWIGLHLPRQALVSHLGFEPSGGLCWKRDVLASRLLFHFVKSAKEEENAAPDSAEHFMQLAAYNLVGALFGRSELPRHFSHGDKLFLRVCGIVKRYFLDPDVGPIDVAAEAGISVRYLQKLFAARGTTCGHYIHTLRLERAASILNEANPTNGNVPIAEIARACGYRDYAHFARQFRARFGRPPSSFRECTSLF